MDSLDVLSEVIATASLRKEAQLCITNARVLDVYNKEWFEADVLISEGYFTGYAQPGEGRARLMVDARRCYLIPGLIDSHVHIESSHATPAEFSNLVVPCGTTTVIADPHEICNVCGLDGLSYMLDASENIALQAFFMV
ncbi:MAG: amidohydrolase family protein, partial [Sphaerochaeta sp.]|nr:amidohydrolase family protein [Sphaerochaeta sp.]